MSEDGKATSDEKSSPTNKTESLSQEQLLKTIDQPKNNRKSDYGRSASHANVMEYHQTPGRPLPSSVPKRTGSLINMDHRQGSTSGFNIADFLQSKFHPTFTPNGKKLTLKVDTRGYEPDELSVRLIDNTLLVHGRKKSFSTTRKTENKQFSQSIRLPDGIDKYNVTSQVMDDGMLFIEIPLINSSLFR